MKQLSRVDLGLCGYSGLLFKRYCEIARIHISMEHYIFVVVEKTMVSPAFNLRGKHH